jgi:hypothetical protein
MLKKSVLFCIMVLYLQIGGYVCFAESILKIDGYVNTRYDFSQNVPHGFQLHKAVIGDTIDIDYWVSSRIEVTLKPMQDDSEISDLYIMFSDFPDLGLSAEGNLLIGRTRNKCFGMVPTNSNRKSSGYGIVSDFITKRRVTGFQYMLDYDQVKVNFGVFNGFEVGSDIYGTQGDMLVLKELDSESDESKEVSVRFTARASEEFELGFSGSSSEISSDDVDTLNTLLNTDYESRNYSSFGVDFRYKHDVFSVQGEIFSTSLSDLECMLYETLGVYYLDNKEFYLRMCYIAYTGAGEYSDFEAGWDKLQITPFFIYRINEKYWIHAECNLNSEVKPSGADTFENSELFVELRVNL